jgi:hypothetical protein
MKVLKSLVLAAVIGYLGVLTGTFFERHLTWKPVGSEVWQKQILTQEGVSTISVDYSFGDALITKRTRCYGTARQEEVYDYVPGKSVANLFTCTSENVEVKPDPNWRTWLKDVPRPRQVVDSPAKEACPTPPPPRPQQPNNVGLV